QPGLSCQEDGELSGGVPFEVGEQGQQGEDVGPEVVGFVDDQQDGEMSIFDKPLDLVLDDSEGHGSGPLGLEAHFQGELAAEVGGIDEGVVQVQGADLVGMEIVSEAS